jgi:hypothetical protein
VFDLAAVALCIVAWRRLKPRSVFVLLGMVLLAAARLISLTLYYLIVVRDALPFTNVVAEAAYMLPRLVSIAGWVFLVLTVLPRRHRPTPPVRGMPVGGMPVAGRRPSAFPGPADRSGGLPAMAGGADRRPCTTAITRASAAGRAAATRRAPVAAEPMSIVLLAGAAAGTYRPRRFSRASSCLPRMLAARPVGRRDGANPEENEDDGPGDGHARSGGPVAQGDGRGVVVAGYAAVGMTDLVVALLLWPHVRQGRVGHVELHGVSADAPAPGDDAGGHAVPYRIDDPAIRPGSERRGAAGRHGASGGPSGQP